MKRFAAIIFFSSFLLSICENLSANDDSHFFSSARIAADTSFFLPNNNKYSGSLTNFMEINKDTISLQEMCDDLSDEVIQQADKLLDWMEKHWQDRRFK